MVLVSPPARLPSLSQPVEKNYSSLSSFSSDIPPQQINQSLHYYDQDVVRELSIPPEQLSSGPRRYQLVNGSIPYSEQTAETSSFPFHQFSQHVSSSINPQLTRPRTPPVNSISQHGLPTSLPPPPRTTFVAEYSNPSHQEPSDLVRILDSMLRGSYNTMLASKPDTIVQGAEAPAVENNAGVAIDFQFSLDDILQPDVCEDSFLTSPQLDQTPETPCIDTPYDENFCSPFLDDGAYNNFEGMPPPFGSIMPQAKEETCVIPAVTITPAPPPAFDSFGSPQYITSPLLDPASCFPDASKAEPVTPALPSLDDALYKIPQTPALSPSLLLTPARPRMQLPPSTTPSHSASASVSTAKPSRPTKPLPTGIRRGITPTSLVPLDAPTQSRNYTAPSATSRKLIPAAFKAKKRGRSEVDGGDDEEESEIPLDPNTMDAIEAKRRQNTLAARRSRMRKLEHTRELEESLAAVTQDRDMWMARAYEAENKLRAHGIS